MDTAKETDTHTVTGRSNVTAFVHLMVNISFQCLDTIQIHSSMSLIIDRTGKAILLLFTKSSLFAIDAY